MSKRPAEDESSCSFFLERKKRPCRMKTLEGMSYCPHHSHLGSETNEKKGSRIPCPLDSSHFCYESKLQKHLKICNAREKERPEYFVENINGSGESSFDQSKASLNDVSDDKLLSLIQKIKNLFSDSNLEVIKSFDLHPTVVKEMEAADDGANSFKHMKQQAALLEIMRDSKLLSNGTCFVEFGAGKGQLMYWIVKCVPEKEKASFILIDKSAQRHKSDNKYKGENLHLERLRIDIQHLCLGKIPSLKLKVDKVVGVSKHLCGSATDLALKCMTQTLTLNEDGEKENHKAVALVMALCCYHRCIWSSYVGKQFMEENEITELDFKLMCCMASWSTCGLRKTDNADHIKETVMNGSLQDFLGRYKKLGLEHEERTKIGNLCKRLIDMGRIQYLNSQGYKVRLVEYVDSSITLENVALVAVRNENKE